MESVISLPLAMCLVPVGDGTRRIDPLEFTSSTTAGASWIPPGMIVVLLMLVRLTSGSVVLLLALVVEDAAHHLALKRGLGVIWQLGAVRHLVLSFAAICVETRRRSLAVHFYSSVFKTCFILTSYKK